ncbi:MAG: Rrf2 family transcriptional regulator [candidate division WOR-3 bacterium]|nr:Rrf2 family transcriptional regulator [candidate division WOR-3 bacterium]
MGSIINLSEATYLAFHALALINIEDKRITVKQIAAETGTSANHLSKIMQILAKAGYVDSIRGPSGGFQLIQKPEDILMKDIYELFEGKLQTTQCPFNRIKCPFKRCVFGDTLGKLSNEFIDYLNSNTLKDIIDNINQGG